MSDRMVVTQTDFHRRILARYGVRTGKGIVFPSMIFRKVVPVLPATGGHLFFPSHRNAGVTRSVTLHLHLHGMRTLPERTWSFTRFLLAGHPRSGPIASVRPLPRTRTRLSGYPGSRGGFPVFVNLKAGDGTRARYHGPRGDGPWTGRPGKEDVSLKEKGAHGAPPLSGRTRFPVTAGEKAIIPRKVVLGSGHASPSMDFPYLRRSLTVTPGRAPLRAGEKQNGSRLSGPLAASTAGTRTLPCGSANFLLPSAPGPQVLLRSEGVFPGTRPLPAPATTGRTVPGTPATRVAGPFTPTYRPGAGKERDLFRTGPPMISSLSPAPGGTMLSRPGSLTLLVTVPGGPPSGEGRDRPVGGKQGGRALPGNDRERGHSVWKAVPFLQSPPVLFGRNRPAERKAASFLKIAPGLRGKPGVLLTGRERPRLTEPEHPYWQEANTPLFREEAAREPGTVDHLLYVKNQAGGLDREVEDLKTAVKAAVKTMEERADQLQRQAGTGPEEQTRVRLLADQVYRLIEQRVHVGRERRGIF